MNCGKHGGLNIDQVYVSIKGKTQQYRFQCIACKNCRIQDYHKAYYRKNQEEQREIQRLKYKINSIKLTDAYIVKLLRTDDYPMSAITPELIDIKRAIVKITRKIRKKNASTNS